MRMMVMVEMAKETHVKTIADGWFLVKNILCREFRHLLDLAHAFWHHRSTRPPLQRQP